jgi:hypothetical protein
MGGLIVMGPRRCGRLFSGEHYCTARSKRIHPRWNKSFSMPHIVRFGALLHDA